MRTGARIAAVPALILMSVLCASAQADPIRGAISGTVVDAMTGQPIAGAVLLLRPELAHSAPATPGAASPGATRSARSDSTGAYRFARVRPGQYELRTERIGYREVVLGIEVIRDTDSRVAVGLTVVPVMLEPIIAAPEALTPFAERDPDSPEREARVRVTAERTRLSQGLSVDVQTLTHTAIVESVTLAEPDLFRALHRAPGVTTRDDHSAELWTRGARWDLTRVYFDGVPVFDPHHAFGVFSAINPEAVGAVYLHPGVAPASFGDGAAGVIDLRSRRGGGRGRVRGAGELSLITGRAALDQQMESGDLAWMLSGRRSHIDWLTKVIAPDSAIPYSFTDFTARFDAALDEHRSVEIAGTRFSNVVEGRVLGQVETFRRWGSGIGRGTLDLPLSGGRLRTTGAFSRSSYYETGEATGPTSRGGVSMMLVRGEWAISLDSVTRWNTGVEIGSLESVYQGGRLIRTRADRPDSVMYHASRTSAAAWLAHRWRPAARLTLETMLRTEASIAGPGSLLLSPRWAARYQLAPGLSASLAAGQSFQNAQAIAPQAPGLRSEPRAQYLWLIAGDTIPWIRSRVATMGLEYWIGDVWVVSTTAFIRGIEGLALADPTPGELLDRRTFLTGSSQAHGFEASVRRLSGRWTVHGAYSYGQSASTVGGYRYHSPEERTHAVDVTAVLRLGNSLRWAAAYTAMSGSPFTQFVRAEMVCEGPGPCRWERPPVLGAPGSERGPGYSSLDVLADWSRRVRGVRLGAYLQIHNVLNHENDVTYHDECTDCDGPGQHRFGGGIPRMPIFGIRAAF